MKEEDCKPSTLVGLKNHSPTMVVKRFVPAEAGEWTGREMGIHCSLIDKDGVPHEAVYSPEQLELREDIKPSRPIPLKPHEGKISGWTA